MEQNLSVTVAVISGSKRSTSATEVVTRAVGEGVVQAGGDCDIMPLGEYQTPPLNLDNETPADAERLTDHIRRADAVLLGTPVYHGSYSGALKCALDYCGFDEFENTVVGLVAVAGGSFPSSSLTHMRIVCQTLNAWVMPKELAVPDVPDNVDTEVGQIADEEYRERAHELGRRLVGHARRDYGVNTLLSEENEGA